MRLVNRQNILFLIAIVVWGNFLGVKAKAQTSKYISEVEYNTVNRSWLNPQNIQLLPYLNVNNIFLYNKSVKIWKGSTCVIVY